MKRRHWSIAVAVAVAGGATLVAPLPSSAAPKANDPEPRNFSARQDDLPSQSSDAQRDLMQRAADQVAAGKAEIITNAKGKRVVEVSKGRYVNYDVQREEAVFTILAEFGDKTMPAQGGTAGPLHNQIPKPDRAADNSTLWAPNFDRDYYLNLMFGPTNSFKDFYQKQSLGRFKAKGDVSAWVKVPYNEARYGHNPVEGDGTSESEQSWAFVRDAVTAWVDAQKAAGKSDAEIKAFLAQFDKVDRYDHDGDGDFNEPDGYIDHIQIIHAGEGEDGGGGAQGKDAIWSHRWYAFDDLHGKTGPAGNLKGGTQIGATGLWVGDYTTEPENGGLGVFVHEFGHDLGLVDFYDTKGGDNGTGFWTLMSSGSWLNAGAEAIGDRAGYMGAKEKIQLGWADVTTVPFGEDQRLRLGPADRDDVKRPQVISLQLPPKKITTQFNKAHSGSMEWWSGDDDNLANTLSRDIDLTSATSASVSAWIEHKTEDGFDFLTAQVSEDGTTWVDLEPKLTGNGPWTQHTWDLTPYVGKKGTFRFLYTTDANTALAGAFLDDLTVTIDGKADTDDVEKTGGAWRSKGFTRINGSVERTFPQYYLLENRVYSGYDQYLKTGPYNYGWADTRPTWVERFPYQNGMLVWYCDGSQKDNNTSQHPGYGQALVVDAHSKALVFPKAGKLLGNRRQAFDATFGLEKTDPVTFHRLGEELAVPAQPAVSVFNDTDVNRYWDPANPMGSSKVAGAGVDVRVTSSTKGGDELALKISYKKN